MKIQLKDRTKTIINCDDLVEIFQEQGMSNNLPVFQIAGRFRYHGFFKACYPTAEKRDADWQLLVKAWC